MKGEAYRWDCELCMVTELMSLDNIQSLADQYGYWVIFIGVLLENAGIPLPGETITLVGGFLAGSGELNYGLVVGSAIAGAVLGDNFGYWLGRYGGWALLVKFGRLFRIPEAHLERARIQFSENAPKAVLLGRFVALLRIFAGPLAGIAQMPYPQFLLCNTTGATLWAFAMVTLAYCVGNFVPLAVLISWVAKFAIGMLLIVATWISLSIWLESRKTKLESEK
jgi:membrane protein DedA with SNARE-associated domain